MVDLSRTDRLGGLLNCPDLGHLITKIHVPPQSGRSWEFNGKQSWLKFGYHLFLKYPQMEFPISCHCCTWHVQTYAVTNMKCSTISISKRGSALTLALIRKREISNEEEFTLQDCHGERKCMCALFQCMCVCVLTLEKYFFYVRHRGNWLSKLTQSSRFLENDEALALDKKHTIS